MLRTPLFDLHSELGAHFTEFAGWKMPLKYKSSIKETLAVRNGCGLFDVSHMGRLVIKGPDSLKFLQLVATNDVDVELGRGRYTLILNESGGIKDDDVVFRIKEKEFLMVINAGSREKIIGWLTEVKEDRKFDVDLEDITFKTVMIAIQGPRSAEFLSNLVDLPQIRRYRQKEVNYRGDRVLVSRTGYTGEDGYELIFHNTDYGEEVFRKLVDLGVEPCGLGARDILRLEAGMCLYGQDMDENTTPIEAQLEFVVRYDKDFIGKEALLRRKEEPSPYLRVGIKSRTRRSPRHGSKLFHEGEEVGWVTSGTFSPTIGVGIGMGYLRRDLSKPGTELKALVSDRQIEVVVSEMPFYDTTVYGYKRKRAC